MYKSEIYFKTLISPDFRFHVYKICNQEEMPKARKSKINYQTSLAMEIPPSNKIYFIYIH